MPIFVEDEMSQSTFINFLEWSFLAKDELVERIYSHSVLVHLDQNVPLDSIIDIFEISEQSSIKIKSFFEKKTTDSLFCLSLIFNILKTNFHQIPHENYCLQISNAKLILECEIFKNKKLELLLMYFGVVFLKRSKNYKIIDTISKMLARKISFESIAHGLFDIIKNEPAKKFGIFYSSVCALVEKSMKSNQQKEGLFTGAWRKEFHDDLVLSGSSGIGKWFNMKSVSTNESVSNGYADSIKDFRKITLANAISSFHFSEGDYEKFCYFFNNTASKIDSFAREGDDKTDYEKLFAIYTLKVAVDFLFLISNHLWVQSALNSKGSFCDSYARLRGFPQSNNRYASISLLSLILFDSYKNIKAISSGMATREFGRMKMEGLASGVIDSRIFSTIFDLSSMSFSCLLGERINKGFSRNVFFETRDTGFNFLKNFYRIDCFGRLRQRNDRFQYKMGFMSIFEQPASFFSINTTNHKILNLNGFFEFSFVDRSWDQDKSVDVLLFQKLHQDIKPLLPLVSPYKW
jgi:hypothetical protein